MSKKTIDMAKITISTAFVSFAVSSASLFMIPFLQLFSDKAEAFLGYAVAALFWLGLVFGILSSTGAGFFMKKRKKRLIAENKFRKQKLPGIITFSLDLKRLALYAVCLISTILLVTDLIFGYMSEYVMFPLLALLFLSFTVHCIVDGENYKLYLTIKKGIKKGYEQ